MTTWIVGRRVLLTAASIASAILLAQVPLPGVQTSLVLQEFGSPAGILISVPGLSVLSVGLAPVFFAFVAVEIAAVIVPPWRKFRAEGARGRRNLVKASLALGLLFTAIRGYALALTLESYNQLHPGILQSQGMGFRVVVALCVLAGTLFALGLVWLIQRYGVGNGFSVMVLVWSSLELATEVLRFWRELGKGDAAAARFLSSVVILFAAAFVAVWAVDQRGPIDVRHAPPEHGHGLARIWIQLPTTSIVPIQWSAAWLGIVGTMSDWGLPLPDPVVQTITRDPIYTSSKLVFVLVFGYLLARMFYRESHVAERWEWIAHNRVSPQEVNAYVHWRISRAHMTSLVLLGGLVMAEYYIQQQYLFVSMAVVLIATSIVYDLRQELRFRLRHGEVASVHSAHSLYAFPVERLALAAHGIPVLSRALGHRSMLHLFGPFVPVELLVPKGYEAEARAALAEVGVGKLPPALAGNASDTQPN